MKKAMINKLSTRVEDMEKETSVLQGKLQSRTKELAAAHEEIKELKEYKKLVEESEPTKGSKK